MRIKQNNNFVQFPKTCKALVILHSSKITKKLNKKSAVLDEYNALNIHFINPTSKLLHVNNIFTI